MSKEVLIEAHGVSKKFCKDLKTSLKYGLSDSFKAVLPFSHLRKQEKVELRDKEFWAIKDISFELRRGECLGLIGHNGAGKSTLLKVLNGLIKPDEGEVVMRGKVGALIELGAGFNPILTGKENIYNNAAVLGFSKQQIDEKLDEIIAFSEIGEFIDTPVQNYSSGMKVRLGFAVAAHLEPDILIIDEVLAVGDLGFVLKCFKTIDKILPNTAVVFVSHNMPMVARICSHIILMDKGRPKYQGPDVAKGIDLYYNKFANNKANTVFSDNTLKLLEAKAISNNYQDGNAIYNWLDTLELKLKFQTDRLTPPYFNIILFDKEQRPVAILSRNKPEDIGINDGIMEFSVKHQDLQLSKGIYSVNISVQEEVKSNPILRMNNVLSFQVSHEEDIWQPFLLTSKFG